jgi:uncharacterized membrane protein
MAAPWERPLARWAEAGLVDTAAVDRIRAWESAHGGATRLRWPAQLALSLGGLMISAGVLLFVAAHWEALGPWQRFALVLGTVGAFHLAGAAAAEHSSGAAAALHACGTAALGGAIFLTGQIFHLEEHWPGGLLLWALGAWIGWGLLHQWPQGLLAALLTPAWLAGEWIVATEHRHGEVVLSVGLLVLALTYLSAEPGAGRRGSALRRALVWTGALGLIPATLGLLLVAHETRSYSSGLSGGLAAVGWGAALGLPLALAWWLRGRAAAANLAAALWAVAGTWLAHGNGVLPYLWSLGFSLGLVAWGVVDRRRERINLGVAGFALTVVVFYFSSVMDRLGRSASLIGLGLLFLGGGYLVERARRRLLARVVGADG